ncbi:hypothetical protein K3495_g11836 [Podosphaera aphanis]|nr:hypothetical protein K3495_g11836 [Podosphaera aphanis]
MFMSETMLSLASAFTYGILTQTAGGTLVKVAKGDGSKSLFRDFRRLVLVMFLFSAFVWTQVSFFILLNTMPCQVTLIVLTGSDQLARAAFEQFLLMSVGVGSGMTKLFGTIRLMVQGAVVGRLMAGGALAAFTQQLSPDSCVAVRTMPIVALGGLALDAQIIGALLALGVMRGSNRDKDMDSEKPTFMKKPYFIAVGGLALWFLISIPMTLAFPSFDLALKTILPSNGILILIGMGVSLMG